MLLVFCLKMVLHGCEWRLVHKAGKVCMPMYECLYVCFSVCFQILNVLLCIQFRYFVIVCMCMMFLMVLLLFDNLSAILLLLLCM